MSMCLSQRGVGSAKSYSVSSVLFLGFCLPFLTSESYFDCAIKSQSQSLAGAFLSRKAGAPALDCCENTAGNSLVTMAHSEVNILCVSAKCP